MPKLNRISRRHLLLAGVIAVVNAPLLLFLRKRQQNQARSMIITVREPFPKPTVSENGLPSTVAYRDVLESAPDIVTTRMAEFLQDNASFRAGLYFVFSGNPSDRKVQVTTSLMNSAGRPIAKQTQIHTDVRTQRGNDYFGFHMSAGRENSAMFYFKDLQLANKTSSVQFEIRNI